MAKTSSNQSRALHARNPYAVLGIARKVGDKVVHAAWRRLRDIHTDPVKVAELDHAYFQIAAERKAATEQAGADRHARSLMVINGTAEHLPDEGTGHAADAIAEPDAVPDRVPHSDPEQTPPGMGFTPTGPDITLEEARHEMQRLEREVGRDRLAQCETDRQIGLVYLRAQGHYAGSNLTLDGWCRQYFGISYTRITECVTLVELWPEFLEAHKWYEQEGYDLGWRVQRGRGARYGKDVVRLRRDARSKKQPGEREAAAEAKREAKRKAQEDTKGDPQDAPPPVPVAPRRPVDFDAQVAELEEARIQLREDFETAAAAARREREHRRTVVQQLLRQRSRTRAAETRAVTAEARAVLAETRAATAEAKLLHTGIDLS